MVKEKRPAWRKGQSSASNPVANKHRSAAHQKLRIPEHLRTAAGAKANKSTEKFRWKPKPKVAPLTVANLTKHTLNTMGPTDDDDTANVKNMADVFAKVNRFANSPLEAHLEAVAVLECVKEAINDQGGEHTETAYYGTLMTLMDQHKANEESITALAAVCYLVSLVLPCVPANVQRQSFFQSADVMATCLSMHTTTGTTSMNKALVESLGVLLVAQESAVWSEPATIKMFMLLLSTTSDPRPKIRHRAVDTCARILKNPPFPLQTHPAAPDTATVLRTRLLESVTEKDSTTTIHTLSLLVRVISFLPSASIKSTCEAVLRVLQSGQAQANQLCFQAFQALFAAGTDSTISPTLARQLVLALFEYKPNVNDVELYSAWLKIITRAVCVLTLLNSDIGLSLVPQVSQLVAEPLALDNNSTWGVSAQCLRELIGSILKPKLANDVILGAGDNVVGQSQVAQVIAEQLEGMLGFKCARVWNLVLDIIGSTYDTMGKTAHPVMDSVFQTAVQLYATPEFHSRQSMMSMVGKACKALGPQTLFELRPLGIDTSVMQDEFPWVWMLVAVLGNIQRTEMAYFVMTLMPLATQMGEFAEKMKDMGGRGEQAALYLKIHRQLWSLFPGFCTQPTDVVESFPMMARTLGEVIRQRADLRVLVCDGLKVLIETRCMSKKAPKNALQTNDMENEDDSSLTSVEDPHSTDRAVVGKFAKNFLPLLFNAYSESETQDMKHSVLRVLDRYAAIADKGLVNSFFGNVMRKLLENSTSNTNDENMGMDEGEGITHKSPRRTEEQTTHMHTMMNLAFTLLNHLNANSLGLYYKVVCPQMLDRDATVQKLSYQALCAIWDPTAPQSPHREFAQANRASLKDALAQSYLACSGAAKKQRLRITMLLVEQAAPAEFGSSELEIIPSAVTEAILATKEVNEKTRGLAYKLLVTMGTAMIRAETIGATFVNPLGENVPASLDELFLMVVAGLGGTTPHMISASVMSLGRLFFEFSGQLTPEKREELLQTMLLMLKTKNREIAKAMLAFFKICIACVPQHVMGKHLPLMIETMLGWPDDQKTHFKMKIRFLLERLIRKYGLDEITQIVPENDRKLITNIRKRKEQDLRKRRELKEEKRAYAEAKNANNPASQTATTKAKAMSFEDILYGADSDDSDFEDDGAARVGKKDMEGATWLKGDQADSDKEDVLDFLDASAVNRMVTTDPSRMSHNKQKAHWSDFDADGKMLVEDPEANGEDDDASDSDEDMGVNARGRVKGKKRSDIDMDGGDDDDKKDWNKHKRNTHGTKAPKSGPASGAEYGSKKASGDMRRKGNKFEPFAKSLSGDPMDLRRTVRALLSKRGFLFDGSIYGPNPAFVDFGPYGCALARNLTKIWWRSTVQTNPNIYGYEGSTFVSRDSLRAWPGGKQALSAAQGVIDTTDVAIKTILHNPEMPRDELRELLKDRLSILHLRPSAIYSVLGNFHSIISATSPKLPFGVAQAGTVFAINSGLDVRSMTTKPDTSVSNNFFPVATEETHLDLTYFVSGKARSKTRIRLQFYAEERLAWWRSLVNTPTTVRLSREGKDSYVITYSISDCLVNTLETIDLLDDDVLEQHRNASTGKSNFMALDARGLTLEKPHVIRSVSAIGECLETLFMDGLDMFELDMQRLKDYPAEDVPLSLHPLLAPVQISVWDRSSAAVLDPKPQYMMDKDERKRLSDVRQGLDKFMANGYIVNLFKPDDFKDENEFLRLQRRTGTMMCAVASDECHAFLTTWNSAYKPRSAMVEVEAKSLGELVTVAEREIQSALLSVPQVNYGIVDAANSIKL
eukprot:CFRG3419T1